MATLCKLQCLLPSIPPRKLFFSTTHHHHQLQCDGLSRNFHDRDRHHHSRDRSWVCTCSVNNSRVKRKAKTNEELRDDIKEFLLAAGLPEGHVPSTKELIDSGRKDLANIVRRRGHKQIRDLLISSPNLEVDGSVEDQSSDKGCTSIHQPAGIIADQDSGLHGSTPQDSSVDGLPKNYGRKNEAFGRTTPDCTLSSSSSSPTSSKSEQVIEAVGALKDEDVSNIEMDDWLSRELPFEDENQKDQHMHPDLRSDDEVFQITSPDWASSSSCSSKSELLIKSVGAMKDENVSSIDVDDWLSGEPPSEKENQKDQHMHPDQRSNDEIEVPIKSSVSSSFKSISDDSKGPNVGEHSGTPMDFKDDASLEDEVAEFIPTGDLDAIDGNDNDNGCYARLFPEKTVLSPSAALSSNGKASIATSVTSPVVADNALRNDDSSAQAQSLADLKKDDVETNTSEIEVQINDLKLLLQEKELELNQLKEQIEKETLSLSDLQTKAEIEITKAQQRIVEKDAELLAVEESLSDLVEVTIQYHGEGQFVEVLGSFNGWHHKIMMDSASDQRQDMDPSSSAENIKELRKASIWSTTLWLYPGVYEIKFIVDGEWRTDDCMESVKRGGISNNILRVSSR